MILSPKIFLLGGIPYFLYVNKYKIPKGDQELTEKNNYRIESSINYKESD